MIELQEIKTAILDGNIEFLGNAVTESLSQDVPVVQLVDLAEVFTHCCYYEYAAKLHEAIVSSPAADSDILRLVAKRWFQLGRFDQASDVLRQALRTDTREDLLVELSGCLERAGKLDEAESLVVYTRKLYPVSAQAARLHAHLMRRRDCFDLAIQILEHHLERYSGTWDWGLQYELANVYDRIGAYDDAWMQLQRAKSHFTETVSVPLSLSMAIRKRQAEVARLVTDNDLSRWFGQKCKQPMRINLMGGFPRSGTTLLEQMLSAHSQCIGTDESGILSRLFVAPIVWDAPDAFQAILEIRSFDDGQLHSGRREYLRASESYLGRTIGDRQLIEKDPLSTADLPTLLRLFPEAKIIMPLRDPRDVVISYFFTMVPINWNSAPAIDIENAARFYHDCMRHWLLFRNRLEWPWHEFRYEQMVEDPKSSLQKLLEFLEIPWQDSVLDAEKRGRDSFVKTPTYDDITKPIYQRAVRRWHHYEQYLEPVRKILDGYAKELEVG